MIALRVNGATCAVDVDAGCSLLSVVREQLGLTGTKYGCGEGQCGACLVLVDEQPVPACLTSVGEVVGREIVTIEGLGRVDRLHPVQRAFLDEEAFQCGYCTPGMIIAATVLLRRTRAPSEREIIRFLQPNLCRCGTYRRIVAAVQRAAAQVHPADASTAPTEEAATGANGKGGAAW